MSGRTAPAGRREASKEATRAALRAAAAQLFADRGFEGTTVRDIAQAANVTERTFYRYFDGKDGLIAHAYQAWLARLRAAIVARPAEEPPLTAVRLAMISVSEQAAAATATAPMVPLGDRPFAGLRQSAARPLLRFENAVADAIAARTAASSGSDDASADPDPDFCAQVIARVAVAAFRSAMIYHRKMRALGQADSYPVEQLLEQAFAIVSSQSPGQSGVSR